MGVLVVKRGYAHLGRYGPTPCAHDWERAEGECITCRRGQGPRWHWAHSGEVAISEDPAHWTQQRSLGQLPATAAGGVVEVSLRDGRVTCRRSECDMTLWNWRRSLN